MSQPLPFHPDDIDAVLFDLDGTLIDSDDEEVGRWAHRIARLYSAPPKATRAARKLVMALESPVNALFTALDLVGLDTPVVRLMITLQGTKSTEHLPPVDGAAHLIDQLAARYKLALVSTRTVEEGQAFLASIKRLDRFGAFAGRDTTWRIKPHPQPVRYAARQLGVDPARCLMVGDTTVDIKAGRRAGAWTCGVLCGYGQRRELTRAGAHLILDHTAQLGDWLG
jgi:phosphoglycolate phosphatase-like HAD superfamily hydrolase